MPRRLPVDPIAEAKRQWIAHGWDDAADGMTVVTSVIRAHQLLTASIEHALKPLDLSFQTNADMALSFAYRLDAAATGRVSLAMGAGRLDVTPPAGSPTGQWASVKSPLKCFQAAGTDVTKVTAPFELISAGAFQVSVAEVKLTADPAGAVCPAKAP